MSRGKFQYFNEYLKGEMYDIWNNEDPRGKVDPYEDHELSELMFDLLRLTYSLDSYKSADTGEENYLKDKKEFKEKWFKTDRKDRLNKIIEEQIDLFKEELLKMVD